MAAAARVFVEHGYAAGTTNRIAEAAGLSVGSLYQYFPNKDAILVGLVRRHVDQGRAVIERALAGDVPGDPEGRAALLVDTALEAHRGDPRLHRVLFEESPRPPELLAELHELQGALVEAVAELFGVPRLTAWMMVAATESLVHRFLADRPCGVVEFRGELIALLAGFARG
ncbi:TetR/AcrR family transcriptional regulator [Spirillospora sp. CA-294931]|uniref:TetR/AcrR family transcriptional regulator n=1 Tax=Spirillospora sp. CA-294931 TaxID=3240042 RepID=UPI003D8B7019